jgi:hypothetical protein
MNDHRARRLRPRTSARSLPRCGRVASTRPPRGIFRLSVRWHLSERSSAVTRRRRLVLAVPAPAARASRSRLAPQVLRAASSACRRRKRRLRVGRAQSGLPKARLAAAFSVRCPEQLFQSPRSPAAVAVGAHGVQALRLSGQLQRSVHTWLRSAAVSARLLAALLKQRDLLALSVPARTSPPRASRFGRAVSRR